MHRRLAIVTITFTLAMIGVDMAGQTRSADRPADAAAIRAHIESIFQAFVDKDRAKLEATHGAEWRGFTPWSGHVIRGRDGYMNEAHLPAKPAEGPGHGRLPHRRIRHRLLRRHRRRIVPGGSGPDGRNGTRARRS